jgi:hypothetical protein
VIHLLVSVFLKIIGAKYRQEYFPDFTTVEESVLSILNTKKGASDHMELLHKSGQLSNVVINRAPRQIGGEIGGRNSHVTDPGKTAGSHFIEMKNRDSMPTVDRGRKGGTVGGKVSHATDPGKKRAAISSRRRIVIQCHLLIEAAREAKLPSASLRMDPLNVMLRKR